jgi:formylglycine-generating enzyme required for sulfatase activity
LESCQQSKKTVRFAGYQKGTSWMLSDLIVFISYARADAEFVLKLARDLRAARVKIWIDQLDIPHGERWDRAIQRALKTCRCMVVVLSPNSVDSENVLDELNLFLEEKKRIVPVIHQACEIPFRLRRLQRVDFSSDYDASFAELFRGLSIYRQSAAIENANSLTPKADSVAQPEALPPPVIETLKPLRQHRNPAGLEIMARLRKWTKVQSKAIPATQSQPSWASDAGNDKFGPYADLIVNEVVQRFRWIAPGDFLMGSPESEAGRYDNETQHRVVLTQGFWLADTACTQALWRAVIGNDPAKFKCDINNPVERVSWNDVQQFLQKLNGMIPNLRACLPTEAQWECACRAGTAKPFSFGANITTNQVNYNGDYPYAGGKKGLYREKTVPVKTLPPNPWGLYEMHGNVWEWCQKLV